MERTRWWTLSRNTTGTFLVSSLSVILLLCSVAHCAAAAQLGERPQRPAAEVTLVALPVEQTRPAYRGIVQPGQSSYILLRQAGVSAAEIIQLQKSIRSVYDLQHLRVGRPYTITVTQNGRLHHFVYGISPRRRLQVARQGAGFSARIVSITDAHQQPPSAAPWPRPDSDLASQRSSVSRAGHAALARRAPAASRPERIRPELDLASHAGIVQPGQSSYILLRQAGVSAAEIIQLQKSIRSVYDLQHLRVGRPYTITVTQNGRLHHFVYGISPRRRLQVAWQDDHFSARIVSITYAHRQRVIQGTIHDSLHDALAALGETSQIAVELADVFAWDIDFHTDLRDGDTFKVMIDERYQDGKRVGFHRILAAEVINRQHLFQAIYYPPKDAESDGDYYRPDGTSMRRMFLRSPLRYTRISSRFSHRRFHPILKRYRPHLGIDYAAPIGTPVRSVADGTVAWVGRKGPNGKMVKIRHNNVYTTYYLHLSRYAPALRAGRHVSQGQVIGYVGATGLATGPHLDFRITKRGKYLNPLQHKSIQAPPLSRQTLPIFRAYAKQILAELKFGSTHARTR